MIGAKRVMSLRRGCDPASVHLPRTPPPPHTPAPPPPHSLPCLFFSPPTTPQLKTSNSLDIFTVRWPNQLRSQETVSEPAPWIPPTHAVDSNPVLSCGLKALWAFAQYSYIRHTSLMSLHRTNTHLFDKMRRISSERKDVASIEQFMS